MKCIECKCCQRGWYGMMPNKHVCIGVPEPFIINDINAECTEYADMRTAEPEKYERLWIDYKYCPYCGRELDD